MKPKPLTPRIAIIVGAALLSGSAAGAVADTVLTHFGYTQPASGQVVALMATLWSLHKLNALIDDRK